jgi:hypothetical protein
MQGYAASQRIVLSLGSVSIKSLRFGETSLVPIVLRPIVETPYYAPLSSCYTVFNITG